MLWEVVWDFKGEKAKLYAYLMLTAAFLDHVHYLHSLGSLEGRSKMLLESFGA